MTRYYIEAFDGDLLPILGNLDGQAALGERREPQRCHAWKHLGTEKRPLYRKVRKWHLVTESGHIIQRKTNPYFVESAA